ncbi:reverse transcriptase domain-containing protein, partial [Tanacetum coccineum]
SNLRDYHRQQPPFKRKNTSGRNVAIAYTARNNERKGRLDIRLGILGLLLLQTLRGLQLEISKVLFVPNWDQPFEIMCDASDYAIGAVLGQRIEKHFRPIHYASKTMTKAETNYTTTEKEMLAVVYAFEKFRSYLIMNKSVVYTDYSALKYLFNKKDAKARLLRWVFDYGRTNPSFHVSISKYKYKCTKRIRIREIKNTGSSIECSRVVMSQRGWNGLSKDD